MPSRSLGLGEGYITPGALWELAGWRGEGEGKWLRWLKVCKAEGEELVICPREALGLCLFGPDISL